MTYLLYRATNLVNGKWYIGITGRTLAIRKKRHLQTAKSGRGAAFGAAIRKYGPSAFLFETLVIGPTLEYISALEQAAIAKFKPEYNLTAGGAGVLNFKLSEEAKLKISLANRGKVSRLRGRAIPPDTLLKMSLARKAYWDRTPHTRKIKPKKNGPKRGVRVSCNGVIYESVSHAARAHNIKRTTLKWALRAKKSIGLINGLQFCIVF